MNKRIDTPYRIYKKSFNNVSHYMIRDEDGEGLSPFGFTLEELTKDLQLMAEALEYDVIDLDSYEENKDDEQ